MARKKSIVALTDEQKKNLERLDDTDEVRKELAEISGYQYSPKNLYKTGQELLKKHYTWGDISEKELDTLMDIGNSTNSFITHKFLLSIPFGDKNDSDRTAIIEFADDIIKEYDCKTAMELSLCEVIVSSYYSIMKGSKKIQTLYHLDLLSNVKSWYYTVISKEIEKQSRLYLNAMMTLRALKMPLWNVSIRAQNAFIGENQQFNNNQKPDIWANL